MNVTISKIRVYNAFGEESFKTADFDPKNETHTKALEALLCLRDIEPTTPGVCSVFATFLVERLGGYAVQTLSRMVNKDGIVEYEYNDGDDFKTDKKGYKAIAEYIAKNR